MSSVQSIGISASFLYRAPTLPDNVSGGSGAEQVSFKLRNNQTGASLIATVNISVSAYSNGN